MVVTESVKEMRFVVCKRCGSTISTNLCGYRCDFDDVPLNERPPEDIEVHVYTLTRITPWVPLEKP
jgi:hypothetical protein